MPILISLIASTIFVAIAMFVTSLAYLRAHGLKHVGLAMIKEHIKLSLFS